MAAESTDDDMDKSGLLTQSYYDTLSVFGESSASATTAAVTTNADLNSNATVIYHPTFGNNSDNETSQGAIEMDNDSVFKFMYVVSVSGYVVNATLFFTICCRPKFRRATNYLLANLCISSILFMLAVNLRLFERTYGPIWTYNKANCVLWSVLRRIPQALASLTIVAISCDRSQAARILVNRPSSTDMTKKILRIWIIAVLTTLPRGFLYRYSPDVETSVPAHKCSSVAVGPHGIFNLLYALFHMISIFMLPMCILICDIYSTIQKIAFLKSCQKPQSCQQEEQQDTQLHKKQLQLLRNSCIFAALFMICWLPWGIYQQLGDLPKSILSPEFSYLVVVHFKTLRYLPFTVTSFLPLLLVVCTYDANTFSYWKKCFGREETRTPAAGENHHRFNDLNQARACVDGRGHQRMEMPRNRPRLLVNNIHNHNLHRRNDDNEENIV